MLAHWILEIVSQMHQWKISNKRLAAQLDVTPEYVSMVLNGHRSPAGAEEKFRSAVNAIIEEMSSDSN